MDGRGLRKVALVAACLQGWACSADGGVEPRPGPTVHESSVASNPHNVLSAFVTVSVAGADSVGVWYGNAETSPDIVAPAVAADVGETLVPILGLLPGTTYDLQPVAWGGGRTAEGPVLEFTTGPLPDDLPRYVAAGPDPSPGYVVLAAGPYGLVIDNTGRVVWYHRFPQGPGLNFQALSTGRFAARPPPAGPLDPAPWIELDPLGRVTRTLGCAEGLRARFHDLLVESDGSYWILCDESRVMDLSELGGHPDALVTGTAVQRIRADGEVLFRWSAFDHFEITDVEEAERTGPVVNWTHGNALDLDAEGNLLVSFRNLSEITRIDTRTGEVLWRMGGLRNEFTFDGTAVPPFARQHGVRAAAPGELLFFDNLGDPIGSRARRHDYDPAERTTRLIRSYRSLPPVVGHLGGTVQNLPGGRTLVSFGSAGRVEEYDAEGNVLWWLEEPGYVFRAQRIAALYHPGAVLAR